MLCVRLDSFLLFVRDARHVTGLLMDRMLAFSPCDVTLRMRDSLRLCIFLGHVDPKTLDF